LPVGGRRDADHATEMHSQIRRRSEAAASGDPLDTQPAALEQLAREVDPR